MIIARVMLLVYGIDIIVMFWVQQDIITCVMLLVVVIITIYFIIFGVIIKICS